MHNEKLTSGGFMGEGLEESTKSFRDKNGQIRTVLAV